MNGIRTQKIVYLLASIIAAGLILSLFLSAAAPNNARAGIAGTTLSPGDLAILGTDSREDSNFACVFLVDILTGTEILFTDSGWEAENVFRGYEGGIKYTAPDAIPAGTILTYQDNIGDFVNVLDSYIGTNGFNISMDGDQVFAFQGPTSDPTFIYAVQTNSSVWQPDSTSGNNSALPQGLVDGYSAVAVGAGVAAEYDHTAYDMSVTSGSRAELLAAVGDRENWLGQDFYPLSLPEGSFTVVEPPGSFEITKNAPEVIAFGEEFTYTLIITNATRVVADQVFITDTLPEGVNFITASHDGEVENGVVRWTVPDGLNKNESLTRTMRVSASAPTGANIINDDYGVHASNWITVTRGAPVTTTVSLIDVQVTKRGGRYSPLNIPLVYSLTVRNSGVAEIQDVTLRDYYPEPAAIFEMAAGVPVAYGPGYLEWNFGDQPAGWETTVLLTITLDTVYTYGDSVSNMAVVTISNEDAVPSNNAQTVMTTFLEEVSIQDIQEVAAPAVDDHSPREGETVLVQGAITAVPGEIGQDDELMFIQDPAGGEWSGLAVYAPDGFSRSDLEEGTRVQVAGTVIERSYGDSSVTQLQYQPGEGSLRILEPGEGVTPTVLQTDVLPEANPNDSEVWESVLIRFLDSQVVDDDLGSGDWRIDDGSGTVRVGSEGGLDGNLAYVPTVNDDLDSLTGIGWEAGGSYKVLPRYSADIKIDYAVTFIYHDEEDVLLHEDDLALEIDQSGDGLFTDFPMQADAGLDIFTCTIHLDGPGTYSYRYSAAALLDSGGDYWVNTTQRSLELSGHGQIVEDYRDIDIEQARLIGPETMIVDVPAAGPPLSASLTVPYLTGQADFPPGILAEAGYGSIPDIGQWSTWQPMPLAFDQGGASFFESTFAPAVRGVYSYAVRFNPNYGPNNPNNEWMYTDLSGTSAGDAFDLRETGTIYVRSPQLQVSKSVDYLPGIGPGSLLTYTIAMTNADGALVGTAHLMLTDTLPEQVEIQPDWLPAEVDYLPAAHQLTWDGDLAAGESRRLVIPTSVASFPVLGAGEHRITNWVTVSDGIDDPFTRYSETIVFDIFAVFLPSILD